MMLEEFWDKRQTLRGKKWTYEAQISPTGPWFEVSKQTYEQAYVRGAAVAAVGSPPRTSRGHQVAGAHYTEMGVQPWDVIDSWPLEQRIGAYRAGALKYLMRMGSKDESAQEIAKGKHYLEKLLEVLQEPVKASTN